MRKFMAVLLLGMFAAIVPAAQNATAQDATAKKGASAKEFRWHGRIVRSNKDLSTLEVRKGHIERVVHYDSETKWTKGKETIQSSVVKDGDDVIVLGYYNDKKELVATRIDLRTPKLL
jgi:hypothetical protein